MATRNLINPIPFLRKSGNTWELVVDNEPYLILGAELHNSSMSSARHMATLWSKLRAMNINTILGNVSWEDIEPVEGRFSFTELDAVLSAARLAGFRMILLWFGSFKNGSSSYVPGWVKTDIRRFPRMHVHDAHGVPQLSDNISIFDEACVAADMRAFVVLQQHLADTDSDRTVIMVQVQNEVGLLGDSRDRSRHAEKLFQSPVPDSLVEFLASHWDELHPDARKNLAMFQQNLSATTSPQSWEALFGPGVYTDELFMAYHYALYVERIALAGKQVYSIPLFSNAWLPKPAVGGGLGNLIAAGGNLPGAYPSGGPISNVLDIWHWAAPSLDFIAPDIYAADYTKTCQTYKRGGRPLFIPEQRRDACGARQLWEAIGSHQALGACPFGIDSLELDDFPYRSQYQLLGSLHRVILRSRQESLRMFGFYFEEFEGEGTDVASPMMASFEGFELSISRAFVLGKPGPGCGMVIETALGKYLLIGEGFKVEFSSISPTSAKTGILRIEEKRVEDVAKGRLSTERVLNGDESRSGKWVNMPSEKPTYGDGFIPLLTPAGTKIVEVQVYSLEQGDVLN